MFNKQTSNEPGLLIVGNFLFDPKIGYLSGPTGAHHICPGMAALLSYLVEHSNEIVERDELIHELWPDNDGGSSALNQYIARLRQHFGEKARSAQYIETVPNRGYRLLAPVYGSTVKPQIDRTRMLAANTALVATSEESNNHSMANLIAEFRERKVCRSMLIYTLVIWLVFQVSEVVVPAVGLPDWVNSLVVVLGLLGFPIAAVLSWIFDITPTGVAREKAHVSISEIGSLRSRTDLMFDSALVVTALTVCGMLVASSLG